MRDCSIMTIRAPSSALCGKRKVCYLAASCMRWTQRCKLGAPSQGFDREMYGEEGDANEKAHQDAGELRLLADEQHPS
eukprot:4020893-Prymnesium_polylepis.1